MSRYAPEFIKRARQSLQERAVNADTNPQPGLGAIDLVYFFYRCTVHGRSEERLARTEQLLRETRAELADATDIILRLRQRLADAGLPH